MRENRYRYNNTSGNHNRFSSRDPLPPKKKKFSFEKALIIGFLLFVVGSLGYNHLKKYIETEREKTEEKIQVISEEDRFEDFSDISIDTEETPVDIIESKPERTPRPSTQPVPEPSSQTDPISYAEPPSQTSTTEAVVSTPKREERRASVRDEDYSGLSSIEILERQNHERVVEQARRAGVSTEGSTIDILERINHKRVVEQGKRAGVSTEGSTIDILERINHKRVVEQGRRAGVSTEGSTTDILERINHQRVVEQAKRAGVSTEGSTIDILERINRKRLESRGGY